ncbi:DNA polymerase III subunit chi [Parvularcula sp. LCG005]|uniref:DNA polymerase III subunit chi n=1 Tax=Parvularcula sp. LCG005 TaxID=3078805 RepID=UPI002942F19A|nr:DNA polymerase III subunit chi [Parvularcula sp. LCG005]WOI52363.1 DNA polymerase III subunit chi [Parvularcula sp. LCG005]
MAEVLFYHLERSTLAEVLPDLLERTLDRGWRALVKTGSAESAEALDALLWTYRDDSFLPHAAGGKDARQPIWITSEETDEGRDVLFLVSGGAVPPESFASYTRTVVMFDEGGAPDARTTWKAVKAAGYDATYWRQNGAGKWEKAA